MAVDPLRVCGTAGPVGKAIRTVLFGDQPTVDPQMEPIWIATMTSLQHESDVGNDPQALAVLMCRLAITIWFCTRAMIYCTPVPRPTNAPETDGPNQPELPTSG